ncbi:GNAT family N-acetyltransferase [Kordiimonas marina]|uniref:GNAT family N-acetyltransferase n=1 Tax=Kordiimonas marina TaxID=2872312 RepID=UPI001FF510D3|nr:GNAT family N-acetyltransferase [Kordiimonas marina]MCJ9430190.1 GNAT family N-acetyltransferase [Kordiimonas marina]
MSTVTIRKVTDKSGIKAFVNATRAVYKDDPNWIQPLMMERMDVLQASKNPYFQHAEVQMWVAERDGVPVGRISAQIDSLAQEKWGPNLGHFGHFEALDEEVADALLETAEAWLKERGMVRMQGPWSFSSAEEVGTLVDGFNTPPVFMMPHGRPQYDGWIKAQGFDKAKDMFAYELDLLKPAPERAGRIVKMAEKNKRLTLREIDMKNFDEEVKTVLDIYNEAWSDNWGYVPFTEAEVEHGAKALKPVVKPYRTMLCEYDGEPVAFMLTIPDVNHKIRDLDGKIGPIKLVKLLYRMLNGKEDRCRVPLMGVRKRFQKGPLGAAMAMWMIQVSQKNVVDRGATFGELGWILEDNDGMNAILEEIGCKVYKTYRVYEKAIA